MSKSSNIKEACDKCQSKNYNVDKSTELRHCVKCQHVWKPKDVDKLLLQEAKIKISELETENLNLLEENRFLKQVNQSLTDEATGFEPEDLPIPQKKVKTTPEKDFDQ